MFERNFFFNEILSLIGIVVFCEQVLKKIKQKKLIVPDSRVFKLVLGIILLGFVHLVISVFTKTNWYFYLRNSAIVYSMFSFFIGFYLFDNFKEYIAKAKYPLFLYLSYGLIFPSLTLLDRFTTAAFFPFLFKKLNWLAILGIAVLDIILAFRYDSLTVVLVTGILFLIILLPSYRMFKVLSGVAITGIIVGFIYLYPNLQAYKTHPQKITDVNPYSMFGNIEGVACSHKILGLDGNSTWRAVFWTRLVTERFPENLVGIGFGTPLINFAINEDTVPVEHDDFHDVHVSGGHNTYLTLSVRMGLLFLIFIVLIYKEVFYEYYNYKQYYVQNNMGLYFISFFSITIIGLFNLVLETPTVASTFWILLGVVTNSIYKRRERAEQ